MSDRCLICHYDLAGLDDEAVCPECTANVCESRRHTIIDTASEAHRRSLRRGVALAKFGAAAIIILGAVDAIITQLITQVLPDRFSDVTLTILNISIVVFIVLHLAALLVVVVGWFRATRPDDRFPAGDVMAPLRRWLRVAITAHFSLFLLAMIAYLVFRSISLSTPSLTDTSLIVMQVFSGLAHLVGVAAFVLQVLFMRAISRRVGREALRGWLTHLLWIAPVLAVLNAVAEILLLTLTSPEVGVWLRFGLELVAAIVWFVLWVGVIHRVHTALPRA